MALNPCINTRDLVGTPGPALFAWIDVDAEIRVGQKMRQHGTKSHERAAKDYRAQSAKSGVGRFYELLDSFETVE